MSFLEGREGPAALSNAATRELRLDRTGATVVADAHPRLYEPVYRGKVWTIQNPTAGAAPGTAIATTALLALWNPPDSPFFLSLIRATFAYVSGTLGAGILYAVGHAYLATVPGGTVVTPQSNRAGGTLTSEAKAFSAATGLGVAAALRPLWNIGAMAAQPTTQPWSIQDALDGEFGVMPGCAFSLQEVGGAGTTPLVVASLSFEQVPIGEVG